MIALHTLPNGWLNLSCLVVVAWIFGLAGRGAWGSFRRYGGMAVHLTGASAVCLGLLWGMDTDTGLGFGFHFIGLAFVTLLLGGELAMVAATAASIALLPWREAPIGTIPVEWLLGFCLPIGAMHFLIRLERYQNSANFFVYVMVNGFFGGMLTIALVCVSGLIYAWLLLPNGWSSAHSLFLQYLPLIILPEGILNGMLTAAFVAFRPEWLRTLQDWRYD